MPKPYDVPVAPKRPSIVLATAQSPPHPVHERVQARSVIACY